jgi:hypothetical protein
MRRGRRRLTTRGDDRVEDDRVEDDRVENPGYNNTKSAFADCAPVITATRGGS